MPENYPYVNKTLNKSDISVISADLFNKYGRDKAIEVLDGIKLLGFKYAGRLGFSVSMQEFKFGGEKILDKSLKEYSDKEDELINQFNDGLITENELRWIKRAEWQKDADKMQEDIWDLAKEKSVNLMDLQNSGAVSVSSWVKKISGVSGYVTDPSGNIVDLPLKSNYEKGFTNFEYFVAAKGARKSFADVALRTADSGYLTRRLHDVAQDVISNAEDCGTDDGIMLERSENRLQDFKNRIRGRFTAEDVADPKTGEIIVKKNEPITIEISNRIGEIEEIKGIKVRSPMTCKIAHGICQKCYGYDNSTGKTVEIGEAVGTIASQALGEPTTQLTLKSKSDARASKADVTQGLPRVEELLEARTPKALALLADFDGKIKIIEEKKKIIVRLSALREVTKKYTVKNEKNITVKNGAKVKSGDVLAVANKKELNAEFSGKVEVDGHTIILKGMKDVEVEKETDQLTNLIVKDGDEVKKGDQLTFGSVDPKELARLKDIYHAQKYIIAGVQDVYGIQGLEADDRHLEIITRQMSRYGLIVDNLIAKHSYQAIMLMYLILLKKMRS